MRKIGIKILLAERWTCGFDSMIRHMTKGKISVPITVGENRPGVYSMYTSLLRYHIFQDQLVCWQILILILPGPSSAIWVNDLIEFPTIFCTYPFAMSISFYLSIIPLVLYLIFQNHSDLPCILHKARLHCTFLLCSVSILQYFLGFIVLSSVCSLNIVSRVHLPTQ